MNIILWKEIQKKDSEHNIDTNTIINNCVNNHPGVINSSLRKVLRLKYRRLYNKFTERDNEIYFHIHNLYKKIKVRHNSNQLIDDKLTTLIENKINKLVEDKINKLVQDNIKQFIEMNELNTPPSPDETCTYINT